MSCNVMKGSLLVLGACVVLAAGQALAWDQYSIDGRTGYCLDCHGNFRSRPYTEPGTGVQWSSSLHNSHQTMVSGVCNVCHLASGKFPVMLSASAGTLLLDPLGCAGCHSRAQDGTGVGTERYSAAQRQHHYRAGVTGCVTCHADSNPDNYTPVGEDVQPPYYADPDASTYANLPQDPCNDPDNAIVPEEDSEGAARGLDNDGDMVYDTADTDCAETPGETSGAGLAMMEIAAYDPATQVMDITYGIPCVADDNTIVYGPLAQVSTYGYSGEECHCLNTGSFPWDSSVAPTDMFFLIVGNDGSQEGSYGLDKIGLAGVERPRHAGNVLCPMPQDLADRCD